MEAPNITEARVNQEVYDLKCDIRSDIRLFSKHICELELREYQLRLAYAIIKPFEDRLNAVLEKPLICPYFDKEGVPYKKIYKRIVDVQPRQTGKSEVITIVAQYLLTILPNFHIGVFAPVEQQSSGIIFRRIYNRVVKHRIYSNVIYRSRSNYVELTNKSWMGAYSASEDSNIEGLDLDLAIVDESQDVGDMKIDKSITYMLAGRNGVLVKIGTVGFTISHFYRSLHDKNDIWLKIIIKKEEVIEDFPSYAQFVREVRLEQGEDSDAYKTQIELTWILERGMFMPPDKFAEIEASVEPYDMKFDDIKNKNIYVGIDVAKSPDSTVVCIGEIDFSICNGAQLHPLKRVLCWIEFSGDDYTEQADMIAAILTNDFDPNIVCVDSTNKSGDMFCEYLIERGLPIEPTSFAGSNKHHLYTSFHTELTAKRVVWPASVLTKRTKEYQQFYEQMIAMEKEYKGRLMKVHHPDVKGAKDDFVDSTSLFNWACEMTAGGSIISDKKVGDDKNPEMSAAKAAKQEVFDRIRGVVKSNVKRNGIMLGLHAEKRSLLNSRKLKRW